MASQQNPFLFDIATGPSKYDLSVSLFDGNRQGRRIIEIEIPEKGKLKIAVSGVDQEDGSGERWLFRGYLFATSINCKVHGYLSTQNRKGWIRFQPEGPEAAQYVKDLK